MTETPVEEGRAAPPAPFARKWTTEKPYVPEVTAPVVVPARDALAGEVPGTATLAKARLEALGWAVRVTYAHGHKLGTDIPVETVALRCTHPDGRRGWAIWELGEMDPKKGVRKGSAQGGWVMDTPPSRKGPLQRPPLWRGPMKAEAWMVGMGYVPPPPKPKKPPCGTCGTTHTKKAGCPIDVPLTHTPIVLE